MFCLPELSVTPLYRVIFPSYDEVSSLPIDNGDYTQPKVTQLPVNSIVSRRQYHFNVLGYAHYRSGRLSFNYCYGGSKDILGLEQDIQLPKEILASIRETFGFIIYDYKVVVPQAIHHYPAKEGAYREYFCKYEFSKLYDDRVQAGYTLEFLSYSPNQEISDAITAAIKADIKGALDKGSFRHPEERFPVYRLNNFMNYRELALIQPQRALKLHQIRIDPENSYQVKNFRDLYSYIRDNPKVKATGASGSAQQVEHLPIENFQGLFQGLFADSQVIPGDRIIEVLSQMPRPIKTELRQRAPRSPSPTFPRRVDRREFSCVIL